MGEGTGHNQSLQNYPYKKGDNATLGNKSSTQSILMGTQTGEATDTEHPPPPPQADGLRPAQNHMGMQKPQSQELRALLQNVTTSPHSPSRTPLHTTMKICGFLASGTHSLPSLRTIATAGGVSKMWLK